MNNLFGNRKFGIQPSKPKIRLERMVEPPKPKPLPSKIASSARALSASSKVKSVNRVPVRSATSSARSSPSTAAEENGYSSRGGEGLKPRKRKATRQISPVHQRLESDSEDDDDEDGFSSYEGTENKRVRNSRDIDLKRNLRRGEDNDEGVFDMIHQADIPVDGRARGDENTVVSLRFQYPSASQQER